MASLTRCLALLGTVPLQLQTHHAVNQIITIFNLNAYLRYLSISDISISDSPIIDGSSDEHRSQDFELRHINLLLVMILYTQGLVMRFK